MKAYWLDNPQAPIDMTALRAEGITNDHLPTTPSGYQGLLDAMKATGGYETQDQVELTPDMPNLDALLDKFRPEHHHTEDEVRFVLSGEGIFDIRSRDDRWMRIEVATGDLIVVPANRHHRFFLTEKRAIRCVRLFQDPSGWVAHYRHGDSM